MTKAKEKEMKVEIISKETIKPSSPTPNHLKDYKLSLLDQIAPPSYETLLLFYSFNGDDDRQHHHHISVSKANKLSLQLKQSLSETLTRFYPLAGRVKDNITIDCSDHGAVYVEAQVNCLLQDLLKQPNGDSVIQLVPIELAEESKPGLLLFVQSSFFTCGGVAIGVCISHKIADAATVVTFIRSWAGAAAGDHPQVYYPSYNASSLFPPRDVSATAMLFLNPPFNMAMKEKCLTKRFVFYGPKISALEAALSAPSTRGEAVTALIWKCAVNASRSNSGVSKLSILSRSVDIRKITVPPLPDNSVGNLVGYYASQKDESDIQLQGLVRELREGIQDFSKSYLQKLQREDALEAITESCKDAIAILISNDVDLYVCNSLCDVSLYDIDFGWGNPTWVTNISSNAPNHKNLVGLIDSSTGDGSIEAWVTLSEADMALFERDPDLLCYAATFDYPSVLKSYL